MATRFKSPSLFIEHVALAIIPFLSTISGGLSLPGHYQQGEPAHAVRAA